MKLLKETTKILSIDGFVMFTALTISIGIISVVIGVILCFYFDYLQLKDDDII